MAISTKITLVNGPVLEAKPMNHFQMREMVTVGSKELIGEVVKLNGDVGTIQVYEETEGLRVGDEVKGTGKALSVKLGPGIMGEMFDGIERPLRLMNDDGFIGEGIGLISIDLKKVWNFELLVSVGDKLEGGQPYASCQESQLIKHFVLLPPEMSGEVVSVAGNGSYALEAEAIQVKTADGEIKSLPFYQEWQIRKPRPVSEKLLLEVPLVTGQRVFDMFFPLAKGGTAAIPGGFGTGKTMTQHQLAKWSDADVIVYIGCGERGNEMTEVLHDFAKLIDPKSDKPLLERTILIANTSNMPVAAREASIYTGITIAEYYRDMGYDVAIMADSTSRWAEALREISGRLEEMPAEEGYPAYLPSRIAEFYERAGYVKSLSGELASVTVIGAVSPAGGDFSEPVTENTKRFVNAFFALDKELAYARHYPAVNWLNSYSGYLKSLQKWYKENVSDDYPKLRTTMLGVLYEENRLSDIVQLVGEDVLPDDQRLIIEISRVLKEGFLQQNAFHAEDTYVPLAKQFLMLELIAHLYERSREAIAKGIPISKVKNEEIFAEVIKMKYTISNDDLTSLGRLLNRIDDYYNQLLAEYV